MSRFTAWIALLILIGSVWSQELFAEGDLDVRMPRFGFNILEPIRKYVCNSACMSSDGTPYLKNLACAIKCPELYLPHQATLVTMATDSSTTTMKLSTGNSATEFTPVSSSSTASTMAQIPITSKPMDKFKPTKDDEPGMKNKEPTTTDMGTTENPPTTIKVMTKKPSMNL